MGTVVEMTALTQFRQQFEQARDDLKRECAVLQAQLADKAARLNALNVLLAAEAPISPDAQLSFLPMKNLRMKTSQAGPRRL